MKDIVLYYQNTSSKRHNCMNLQRFFLLFGISLLLISCGPSGEIRYTGQEIVPAHEETYIATTTSPYRTPGRGRGIGKGGRSRAVRRVRMVPTKWYVVISDEKDRTYKMEITQQQHNTEYLKGKVWPNYTAFKKEYYGDEYVFRTVENTGQNIVIFFIIGVSIFFVLFFLFGIILVNIKGKQEQKRKEEAEKERLRGIVVECAEDTFKKDSVEDCWKSAIRWYRDDELMQMTGVYILGLIGDKKSLDLLKNTVSKNPSCQVQEMLAMAFDKYCEKNGYENSLKTITEWLNSKNANIRRAVTEGLRNWIERPYFKENPQEAIQLLSKNKADESEYVRISVGNALKDIGKTYPELIKNEIEKWKLETKDIIQVYKLAKNYGKK